MSHPGASAVYRGLCFVQFADAGCAMYTEPVSVTDLLWIQRLVSLLLYSGLSGPLCNAAPVNMRQCRHKWTFGILLMCCMLSNLASLV